MKTRYIILLLAAALTIGSCKKDLLNTTPLAQSSDATFWKTADDAQTGLNAVYSTLPDSRDFWRDCHSDNSVMTNAWGEGGMGYISMGTYSATDTYIQEEWNYNALRIALNYIDKLNAMSIDAAVKKSFDAQARFILALRYFRMAQLFGDLPLIKEKPVSLEESNLKRSPKQEVLNYVLQNVEIAIAGLPASNSVASDNGHITKAAALMLRANVYLYMASMKKFHDGQDDPELWTEAAKSATEVTTMGFDLENNYAYLFTKEANNNSKEVILAYQYVQNKLTEFLAVLASPTGVGVTGEGWASFCPTRDLIDSYQCKDGKSIKVSSLYNMNKPYENRDLRLKMTFMLPGVPILRPDGSNTAYQPHPFYDMPERMNNEGGGLTGYMYLKFNDLTNPKPEEGWTNWPIYRYAENLLILAEALNESSPADPKIVWAMNKVRTRAGLPGVDALQGNQSAMREAIREERRHEFVAEHKRYFDILRWKIAEDVLSKPAYGINSNVNDPIGDWTKPMFKAQDRVFNPSKNYTWPVPQAFIDRNRNLLPQNNGW
ncbi:RagB/SusD family nutrient uptake outer membrane protein [Pedobacter nutrimenti]|uniref:RagB/SusD family nutrient uptake outer membrane protein n=1 Tax=Pedobacter nutrimenti TaxID=1241337 RepID=UPI00292CC0C8|nr:RagB/SusD family nutrient uptake outer membrane protein [Pedobacter nutrimenti]